MGHALGNNYGKQYSFLSKPVILEGSFIVDATAANGVTGLKGQGVSAVYMHSSSPGASNPNPASGYALIQLAYNYTVLTDANFMIKAPVTGAGVAINGSALTVGNPYEIFTVGVQSAGAVTIQPVADTAGSLASKYFSLYDAYGNTFIIWFKVSGVGSAPVGVSGTLVQQSIATGDTAATIGAALVTTINNLASGISGVFSFTAAGTTTVTATSTAVRSIAGAPADGASPLNTGFTFAMTVFNTNNKVWNQVGLQKGIVPAVGVSFIASAVGYSTGGGSTGTVKAIGKSGINTIEIVGEPNLTINPIAQNGSPHVGGYIMIQFMAPTDADTTTSIATAPAAGSKVYFELLLEQGSVIVAGD